MNISKMVLPKQGQCRIMVRSIWMSSWSLPKQETGLCRFTVSVKHHDWDVVGRCGYRSHLYSMSLRYSGEGVGRLSWSSSCFSRRF